MKTSHSVLLLIALVAGLLTMVIGLMIPTKAQSYCWSKGFKEPLGDKYCAKMVAGTELIMSREDIEKFKDGLININTNFPKR